MSVVISGQVWFYSKLVYYLFFQTLFSTTSSEKMNVLCRSKYFPLDIWYDILKFKFLDIISFQSCVNENLITVQVSLPSNCAALKKIQRSLTLDTKTSINKSDTFPILFDGFYHFIRQSYIQITLLLKSINFLHKFYVFCCTWEIWKSARIVLVLVLYPWVTCSSGR